MKHVIVFIIIFSATFAILDSGIIQDFFHTPLCAQFNLEVGKEYKIKQITVIDGSSYGALINGSLYFVKLDNAHVVDKARDALAELLNNVDSAYLLVKKIHEHDILVDIYLIKHGSKFNLLSWLKERGFVYAN